MHEKMRLPSICTISDRVPMCNDIIVESVSSESISRIRVPTPRPSAAPTRCCQIHFFPFVMALLWVVLSSISSIVLAFVYSKMIAALVFIGLSFIGRPVTCFLDYLYINCTGITKPRLKRQVIPTQNLPKLSHSKKLNNKVIADNYDKLEKRNFHLDSDETEVVGKNRINREFSHMAIRSTSAILKHLRSVMKNPSYVNEALQAYIISSGDAHQSEYIAEHDKRREYVSSFSGSAGVAVVTHDKAALWTDGRYYLQAEQELDENWILMKEGTPGTPTQGEWLSKNLPAGSRIGVDPFLISYDNWKPLCNQLEHSGHFLIPVHKNLIDAVWDNKPLPPNKPVEPLSLVYTGKSLESKITEIRQEMNEKGAALLVITALDEIAWLLNLRGADIDYNPVFFAYVLVTMDAVHLFINSEKCSSVVQRHLQGTAGNQFKITIHPYDAIKDYLFSLINQQNGKIWISNTSSYALVSLVSESRRIDSPNPVLLKKAIKNDVEIACMRRSQIKDAVALCEFFAWLEKEITAVEVTELSAAAKLEEFRKQQEDYVGPSFETISASGPNGAIIHYHPVKETNRTITTEEIYLCDSGGQYKDGTTDVTRTWHFGMPSPFEKECYTRVVKGHIAIATAVFPKFTKGQMLDTLARKALWDAGLDYLHGTGHGVGSFLNVHEGPIGISWKPYPNDPGLQEGMVLSDEPGYYEDGQFGIRIESLMIVKKADTKYNFKERGFLTFEVITLVPIQTKLLKPSMLTTEELEWLDNYHQVCRDIIGKELELQGKTAAHQWLLKETQPLG